MKCLNLLLESGVSIHDKVSTCYGGNSFLEARNVLWVLIMFVARC